MEMMTILLVGFDTLYLSFYFCNTFYFALLISGENQMTLCTLLRRGTTPANLLRL